MAYGPVEQGRLVRVERITGNAARIGVTPAQLALAWTLRRDGVIAVSKSGTVEHVRGNRAAADLMLTEADLAALDDALPLARERRALVIGAS